MRYLLDTNVLLRVADETSHGYARLRRCLEILWSRGDELCYTSQCLGEFWNVSTRPAAARGGFGLSVAEADRRARLLESRLTLLPDDPRVHAEWRRLLVAHSVSGVQVHDARIVAAMNAHGVTHLLTMNVADFRRFGSITLIAPDDVTDAPDAAESSIR